MTVVQEPSLHVCIHKPAHVKVYIYIYDIYFIMIV